MALALTRSSALRWQPRQLSSHFFTNSPCRTYSNKATRLNSPVSTTAEVAAVARVCAFRAAATRRPAFCRGAAIRSRHLRGRSRDASHAQARFLPRGRPGRHAILRAKLRRRAPQRPVGVAPRVLSQQTAVRSVVDHGRFESNMAMGGATVAKRPAQRRTAASRGGRVRDAALHTVARRGKGLLLRPRLCPEPVIHRNRPVSLK